jgi:DNA-binding IclR family transcriptional regulator
VADSGRPELRLTELSSLTALSRPTVVRAVTQLVAAGWAGYALSDGERRLLPNVPALAAQR